MNIPCLTLRKNTERPITISKGTNQLVELDEIEEKCQKNKQNKQNKQNKKIPKWDGNTSKRIVKILKNYLND